MDFRQLRTWLLIVSLAANGLLAGILVSQRPHHPPRPPPSDDPER